MWGAGFLTWKTGRHVRANSRQKGAHWSTDKHVGKAMPFDTFLPLYTFPQALHSKCESERRSVHTQGAGALAGARARTLRSHRLLGLQSRRAWRQACMRLALPPPRLRSSVALRPETRGALARARARPHTSHRQALKRVCTGLCSAGAVSGAHDCKSRLLSCIS